MGAQIPTHLSSWSRAGISKRSRNFMFELFSNPGQMTTDEVISEIASIPTVSSGIFLNNEGSCELTLNIRKYYGKMTKKSNYLWRSESKSNHLIEVNSDIKFRSISPDSSIFLIGRAEKDSKCFLEIWKNNSSFQFLSCIDLSSFHGDFCTDGIL
jgi:hypothetical protein